MMKALDELMGNDPRVIDTSDSEEEKRKEEQCKENTEEERKTKVVARK